MTPEYLPDREPNTNGWRQPKGRRWAYEMATFTTPLPGTPTIDWTLVSGITVVMVGVLLHALPLTWALLPLFGMTQVEVGDAPGDGLGEGRRSGMVKINKFLPFGDGFIHAQWKGFTGTTEQKVTQASAAAAAGGYRGVYIPNAMLPYNPAAVTYNALVQLVREGGSADHYDLRAYGAKGDWVQDETPAIVAALAAAVGGGATSSVVYAPTGVFAHTAITWNSAVSLRGDGSFQTMFAYTPTTGTAWTVNAITAANVANRPRTFGFYGCDFMGPGSGTAIGLTVDSFYFNIEDCGIELFATGQTYVASSANLAFFTATRCHWQMCTQTVLFPNVGSAEKITYRDCTFINSVTFANGVQLNNSSGGGLDMLFDGCSFDQCQLSLTAASQSVQCVGCHFEVVAQVTVPMINMTGGELKITNGKMLVGAAATTMPQGILASDASDAGNCSLSILGMSCFSAIACPFLTLSGSLHVDVSASPRGFTSPFTGSTTGAFKFSNTTSGAATLKTLTYAASIVTGDVTLADCFVVTATNGTAFVFAAPTFAHNGMIKTWTLRNTFGVLGAGTWNAVFKLAAWANPANGFSASITFRHNGTNWVEIGRSTATIPN